MSNKEIFNLKNNWKNTRKHAKFLESLFFTVQCEFRDELTAHDIGSTALAMKICKRRDHPYAKTQFTRKCTIELCPTG